MNYEPIKFTLETLTGETRYMNVKPSDTLRDVKKQIHEVNGVHPDQQRLMLGERALTEDSDTVEASGISHGSIVNLVPLGDSTVHKLSQLQTN
jgi:hypothetical protein